MIPGNDAYYSLVKKYLIPAICKLENWSIIYSPLQLIYEKEKLSNLHLQNLIQSDYAGSPDFVAVDFEKGKIVFVDYNAIYTEEAVVKTSEICKDKLTGYEAIFITSFPDTQQMLHNYEKIAWRTSIWTADCPEHFLHKI